MADVKQIDLFLTETTHKGYHFETGMPVSFPYIHNKLSSRSLGLSSQYTKQFQVDIEPAGKYVNLDEDQMNRNVSPEWEKGMFTFRNPLVLKWSGDDSGRYGPNSWKMRLYLAFKKQRGMALTAALKAASYDGIVTVEGRDTMEIVKL